ncbi:sterol desaturase/sphingolipid hydroxylase (fatty acid hydroxylase superfamily) [Sinobacterium caligoides]|uniref:Sterol desaturase/sphingolipid hydroxylase (Fatty acid hydroxylase superfamily) n=1 Tax=Sinobacterium caligoides TaxID=933926 RepID=A0A3N2DPY6_9GAMM|nr:sterol desaturase family protein [Sinobacterium caligoides]ROS01752.1 sterol desaturase/sphingolipid hydroxylase (fatty acid hydroxylase superfamily) [Sinobacterium caligoides]
MQFGLALWQYVLLALAGVNALYVGLGGLVHWFYYVKNKHKAKRWKIQSDKFLSKKLDREAMLLGTLNMNIASAGFGVIAWGVFEHGWSRLYYDFDAYSWDYTLLSMFLCWLFIETFAFYLHAGGHIGWFYKHIHSVHHRYSAPTFWTISAMHPLEWVLHSSYIVLPAFIIPMHLGVYAMMVSLVFILGYWDHCGIKFVRIPLHGSNKFHDDHHKYFHVNFGFTCSLFDRIHDTVRRDGHHYNELSFNGGKGKVRKPEELGERAVGPLMEY